MKTQDEVKEIIDLRLRLKSDIISDNISRAFYAIQEELKDIELIRDDIKNIELNEREKLDIVLEALCDTNSFYISNPVGAPDVEKNIISWYGKPYVANTYIILQLKFETEGDKEFFAFIPRSGLGTIVVENLTKDELEMDMKSRCMSSMIFSDRPEIILAGMLMTTSSRVIAEYVKYDDNKEGEHYIYFTRDYHGYTVRLTSEDTMLGNFWLEVSKDEKTVAIGPLRPDLDYTDVFDNDIVEPDLLGRVLDSAEL